jgi:hypothetical protein
MSAASNKLLDHIEAQPPPNNPVTAIQSWNILGKRYLK